jgi:hypothetical protein
MPHISTTVAIDATPEAVWAVLGDLTATPDWLPGVVSASFEGSTRICILADGTQIHEQISGHNNRQRSYHFRHLRTPLPVRDLHGSFTVATDATGNSLVTLDTNFQPADPAPAELTDMIQNAFGQSLASLRRWIEKHQRWNSA